MLLPALIIGSIPAGVCGLLWKDEIEQYFHNPSFVVYPLAIVGLVLWAVDHMMPEGRKLENVDFRSGFLIGLFQALALIPGTSRSGATIVGARLFGFDREAAARFSFLLGTPAMLGAALLELSDISKGLTDPVFYIGIKFLYRRHFGYSSALRLCEAFWAGGFRNLSRHSSILNLLLGELITNSISP